VQKPRQQLAAFDAVFKCASMGSFLHQLLQSNQYLPLSTRCIAWNNSWVKAVKKFAAVT